MLSDYSLQEIIKQQEWMFYEVNTREFGENSLMRGGYQFEGCFSRKDGSIYVSDIINADLIMKNENRIYACYIPRIKKALKVVLSKSGKIKLRPEDWPLMLEIAQRVKDNLPDLVVVPDGKD